MPAALCPQLPSNAAPSSLPSLSGSRRSRSPSLLFAAATRPSSPQSLARSHRPRWRVADLTRLVMATEARRSSASASHRAGATSGRPRAEAPVAIDWQRGWLGRDGENRGKGRVWEIAGARARHHWRERRRRNPKEHGYASATAARRRRRLRAATVAVSAPQRAGGRASATTSAHLPRSSLESKEKTQRRSRWDPLILVARAIGSC
jgi:hypothetical protein